MFTYGEVYILFAQCGLDVENKVSLGIGRKIEG